MKQTSKYAIVFLAGAICATAGSAYGAEAIKTISAKLRPDIKVSVNGKQLDASAISYNNTTYLPLRKAAEAVGGKIELSGKDINIVTNTPSNQIALPPSSNPDEKITSQQNGYSILREGAEKNGISIRDINYNSETNTLTFTNTEFTVMVQDHYTPNCDAYRGDKNYVYIRDSLLKSISEFYEKTDK
ncbi:hypothetical protein J4772_27465 [Cohnella sp. LGH]|uniref:stalk domain-containing protein n=1 Tax=Cohnella sp. LGH TaxID=1619153 RepID=UPI001AD953CC|nr:hypothetical protein [Cohnella sp. LGH]QTH41260.1 hypothetical protein J4772_27465 [Cohnella sp. LGH]